MRFKIANEETEFCEEIDLNEKVRTELNRIIMKYPQLKLSLDPNITTFTGRSILNQNDISLDKTFKEHKMKNNSIITIQDKRDVELAINNFKFF